MILFHNMIDIDIHTHTPHSNGIYNLPFSKLMSDANEWQNQNISVGIHPWDVTEDWQKNIPYIIRWISQPQTKAIGEIGLDKIKGPRLSLQKEAFIEQALLAEKVQKPVIIHCVKAIDELLSIKKEINPQQRWIFHGFRGKPQQMQQLLNAGFYISFGEHFNAKSVKQCPIDRMFIESDDSHLIYKEIKANICSLINDKE